MAIVNSIAFGKSRKSAGNVVFYDRLGQTIARQKNLTPTNPNTYAQVSRRILITNPSRIYRLIVEATRASFGNKLFDYSFGKSYLATKRRTAYNEFFFRAMSRANPVFLSKGEVLSRQTGFADTYELAQGSLRSVLPGLSSALADTHFGFRITPQIVGASAAAQLQAFGDYYGYPKRTDFRAVILVFYYKDLGPTGTDIFCKYAEINWTEADGFVFDPKDTGLTIEPTVAGYLSDMQFLTSAFTGGVTGGFLGGYAIIPFASVDNLLTSANSSIMTKTQFPGYAKLLAHTTDMERKELAILSYSPSTPSGSFAAQGIGASMMSMPVSTSEEIVTAEPSI